MRPMELWRWMPTRVRFWRWLIGDFHNDAISAGKHGADTNQTARSSDQALTYVAAFEKVDASDINLGCPHGISIVKGPP